MSGVVVRPGSMPAAGLRPLSAAPAAPAGTTGPTPRTPSAGDRFVAGAWQGGLSGVKSVMVGAVPLVLTETKTFQTWFGKVGPGTSCKGITLLTLSAIGTGAVAGGVAAVATNDRTWGTMAGAAAGGAVTGAINGLIHRSWRGALVGAAFGGVVGAFAGRAGARGVGH